MGGGQKADLALRQLAKNPDYTFDRLGTGISSAKRRTNGTSLRKLLISTVVVLDAIARCDLFQGFGRSPILLRKRTSEIREEFFYDAECGIARHCESEAYCSGPAEC